MVKKAIVCVDDENIILESLGEQIENIFGGEFIYEFAENANEGMEVIEELAKEDISVLVIVSDWLMPGQKGDEFLINVHKKFPKIIKVMLTGQAEESALENAKKHADLFAYISKPWTAEQLEKVIKGYVKQTSFTKLKKHRLHFLSSNLKQKLKLPCLGKTQRKWNKKLNLFVNGGQEDTPLWNYAEVLK